MTSGRGPAHVVVDGSNIATEGRSLPSLAQLNEAVMSFMEEHPDTAITVVVDATFGHRIDKKEVAEFEAGISNNELVAPPAGAVGRGDAFVLGIAQKAKASILSNDSFQEFHADYEWLFDEGRLIGGKPVPHVGWVFVDRVPVRGPVSRKATSAKGGARRSAKGDGDGGAKRSGRKASPMATEPMPIPKTPPPGRAAAAKSTAAPARAERSSERGDAGRERMAAPRAGDVVNELMPFLEFVEHHPVGTSVNGTVESYSSHGAYISIGENGVRGYVPLRLMADPAPPSARKVMQIGESVTLVVVSFAPLRRSIDCAVPDMAKAAIAAARAERDAGDREPTATATKAEPMEKSTSKKPATKKPAAKKAPTKKAAVSKVAVKKAPAKKASARKAPPEVKSPSSKKAPAAKKAAPTKKVASASRPAASKAPAKKAAAKNAAPVEKAAARQPTADKAPAKKAAAVKAPAKNAPAQKATGKKAPSGR